MPVKLFLSYNHSTDERFVESVYFHLRTQPHLGRIFFRQETSSANEPYFTSVVAALEDSALIAFVGNDLGKTQTREIEHHVQSSDAERIRVIITKKAHPDLNFLTSTFSPVDASDQGSALNTAKQILKLLKLEWLQSDGIPDNYLFPREKSITEQYARTGGPPEELIQQGCPRYWPTVYRSPGTIENPVPEEEIGNFRADGHQILVDTRTHSGELVASGLLTLPEAGPREWLAFPNRHDHLTVGILVSGGIAPGINAVIDGIYNRHRLYNDRALQKNRRYKLTVLGYQEGFEALFVPYRNTIRLDEDPRDLHIAAELGGSILGTSRAERLLNSNPLAKRLAFDEALNKLHADGVQILYIIGGDGSMRAAHGLWTISHHQDKISIVGIPKAMDNDVLWVWQSFGFASAVEKAREYILSLHTEVTSNPRVGVIQVFGSDSGFVASHAAYSTNCDLVLIPEDPLTMSQMFAHLKPRLEQRYQKNRPYGLVVMAETALPLDSHEYLEENYIGLSEAEKSAVKNFLQDRRVSGQTPDELRTAGLKIVSGVLEQKIRANLRPSEYWKNFRVLRNEPRHLIRSISPSVSDVIFGDRLGALAVDNAMAGYSDFMVSQWLTEFVLVPLQLTVLGRKRVVTDGIFWKSVVASTGQPSNQIPQNQRTSR